MSFEFLVERAQTIARVVTVDGLLLSGTIHHGDEARAESKDGPLAVVIRTVAFVRAAPAVDAADPRRMTITIDPVAYPIGLLVGRTLRDASAPIATGGNKFVFTSGNPQGDLQGRVELTLDRDMRSATLEHSRGGVVRAWRATLPDDTWENLLEVLGRNEFPKSALETAPRVPGAAATQFSLERDGKVDSVSYQGRTDDYIEVRRIVWNIVAQMTPSIVGGPEDVPPFPRTRIEEVQEVSSGLP